MTTRSLSLASIVALVFLVLTYACNKNEDDLDVVNYPILLNLEGVEDWDFDYFLYNDPGITQINPTSGKLVKDIMHDQMQGEDFLGSSEIITLREIELLSDTLSRIFIYDDDYPIDTTLFSTRTNDSLLIYSQGAPRFRFGINDDLSELRMCIRTYKYSYYDTNRNRYDSSPYDIEGCSNTNPESLVDIIFASNNRFLPLKGDTIAMHFSDIIWKK